MNTINLEKQFARMGARLKAQPPQLIRGRWLAADYSVDVQRDRRGEFFLLTIPETLESFIQIEVLHVAPKDRHLLLLVKNSLQVEGNKETKDRFLCGHDERDWFVAAVPGAVSTVSQAMESLKPEAVLSAQDRVKLNGKQRNWRHNRAFRRQGEWFFVPAPSLMVPEALVLRNEPIARSGGKPHRVQYLYRTGGRSIYLCQRYPNGLPADRYRELIRETPDAKSWNWQVRSVNPQAFAKGEVRHSDHNTIVLHEWHEVLMNRENQSRTMRNVAFID